ncbi:MAG: peptide chain release factor 1 [Clostridia bacterium]|nr:peptide chain release factor 1 [Clostridia bacterium]
MLNKVAKIFDRFRELEQMMQLPGVASDGQKYARLMKEYNQISPIAEVYSVYEQNEKDIRDARLLMEDASMDAELRSLAEEELYALTDKNKALYEQLKLLLVPKDENDGKNVLIEIRQGTGGEEAALFAADIYRMYSMYCASAGFKLQVLSANETELGGLKEIVFSVAGKDAYSKFKFESGTHRVQRIPVTESNGKIQTSAVTVAVLPEAEAVEIEISPADIKFESCKSSGSGGQHINKTESAVRLTHKPTGLVIECDSERSQLQNKEQAMRVLRTKLYDMKEKEQSDRIASERKSQVGSGDRSEKIRTYNYPQSRVTDHRIGKTLYTLDAFMNGNIGALIAELVAYDMAERLKGQEW